MKHKTVQIVMLTCAAAVLSACSTVKLPDFNMPGLEQFKDASAKLVEGYPEVSQAPSRPDDLRSSAEWDDAAKSLMVRRATFVVPEKGDRSETPEAIEQDIEALKAQVRSYKLDDPQ